MARSSATVSQLAGQRVQARTRAGGARQNVRSGVPRRPHSSATRTHIAIVIWSRPCLCRTWPGRLRRWYV